LKTLHSELIQSVHTEFVFIQDRLSQSLSGRVGDILEESAFWSKLVSDKKKLSERANLDFGALLDLSDFKKDYRPTEKIQKLKNSSERVIDDITNSIHRHLSRIDIEVKPFLDPVSLKFPALSSFEWIKEEPKANRISHYNSLHFRTSFLNQNNTERKPVCTEVPIQRPSASISNRVYESHNSLRVSKIAGIDSRLACKSIYGSVIGVSSSKGSELKNFGSQKTLKNSFLINFEEITGNGRESQIIANFQKNEQVCTLALGNRPITTNIEAQAFEEESLINNEPVSYDLGPLTTPNFSAVHQNENLKTTNSPPMKKRQKNFENGSNLKIEKSNLLNEYFNLRNQKNQQARKISKISKVKSQEDLDFSNRKDFGSRDWNAGSCLLSPMPTKASKMDTPNPSNGKFSSTTVKSSEIFPDHCEFENLNLLPLINTIRTNKSKTLDLSHMG
jgi:hypothetical protein